MTLRLGSRLGPYEILDLLGSGGIGEVYRARDTRLGRTVAIKVLPEHAAADPSRRKRFEHEARAASALNHPHICTIHDIEEQDGTPYIVMELLDGMPLRQSLRGGPLALPVLLRLAGQVADALDAAHTAGIIHRDLTPANIFVTARGDAKVLDFGLAKLRGDEAGPSSGVTTAAAETPLTAAGRMLGTPGYASPEQTLGLPVDTRSDLFSFGVVLYEMATGHRAFPGESPALAGDAAVHATPSPAASLNPQIPPGLAAVIDKAIEKEPAMRYQSAAELKADLRRIARDVLGATPFSDGTPALQRPASRQSGVPLQAAPASRWRRWRPALIASGLVAVVALAYLRWGRPPAPAHPLPESVTRQVTGGGPVDIEPALSPDGHTIAYVVDDGSRQSIWMVETRGGFGTPWTRTPGRHRHPAWAPDGRLFFESGPDDRRGIYVAPGFDSDKAMLVVPGGRDPALSPDGRQLAFSIVSESGYYRIHVARVDNWSAVTPLSSTGGGLWDHLSPAWSPDGRRICYAASDGLWIAPADGKGRAALVSKGTVDVHPVWSRSDFIYYSSLRDGMWQLWRTSPDGRVLQRVTGGIGIERMPTVSADGKVLVFSAADDRAEIVVRDLASGAEHPIGGGGYKYFPAFAPDGRSLYLLLDAWNRRTIWVQPLADGVPAGAMQPLLAQDGSPAVVYSQPVASPDGRWVAFLGIQANNRDIFVAPSSGGTAVNVTKHAAADYYPAWAPDSSSLAFVSERDGKPHVWVLPVERGGTAGPARRLTHGAQIERWPAWSPDGARVAMIVQAGESTDVAIADAKAPGVPQGIATGADAERVLWTAARCWLLVAGHWSAGRTTLRAFDPARREYVAAFTEIDLGSHPAALGFQVSADERYLALVRVNPHGGIGVLEAKTGVY